MRYLTAFFVFSLMVGCEQAPPRVFVTLSETSLQLTTVATVFRPADPLPADNDFVGVCIKPPVEYELNDDWTLGLKGEPAAALSAEVTLSSGQIVALPQFSWSQEFCLCPDGSVPPESTVEEIRVWSSIPIEAQEVTWVSTSK